MAVSFGQLFLKVSASWLRTCQPVNIFFKQGHLLLLTSFTLLQFLDQGGRKLLAAFLVLEALLGWVGRCRLRILVTRAARMLRQAGLGGWVQEILQVMILANFELATAVRRG